MEKAMTISSDEGKAIVQMVYRADEIQELTEALQMLAEQQLEERCHQPIRALIKIVAERAEMLAMGDSQPAWALLDRVHAADKTENAPPATPADKRSRKAIATK